MGTHCMIGVLNEDDTVTAIYCHNDGYPGYTGQILHLHYTDLAKIEELMKLGDLSVIGSKIGKKHPFGSQDPEHQDWCISYSRDRGEKGTAAKTYEDEIDYRVSSIEAQYMYLYQNDVWGCTRTKTRKPATWVPIPELIAGTK